VDAVSNDKTCAIIVTYFPDGEFPQRLRMIAAQVAAVIVVDNSADAGISSWLHELSRQGHTSLIENDCNRGIATALNQGLERARQLGFHWAVTLDQDSIAADDMVSRLLASLASYSEPERVALVGANLVHRQVTGAGSRWRWLRPHPGIPLFFQRVGCDDGDRDDVSVIITSGTLMSLPAYRRLGPFRDDFFIDYVDTEYCLRARRNGYRLLVSARAILHHTLGAKREETLLGVTMKPTFHDPQRIYYISRNRIPMLRMYALGFPHWLAFDLVAAGYNLLRILLLEDRKAAKFRAFLLGTLDGLRGRMGVNSRRLS